MIFLEASARTWLILHAVLGAAVVAASTHLVIWTRTYWRGDFRKFRAARWFTIVSFVLYALQFVVGNLIYPTYKVRVRMEYFDEPGALRADAQVRRQARADVARRYAPGHESAAAATATAAAERPRDLTPVSRVFDVKEHWAALGLALAFAALLVAWSWDPKRDGATVRAPGRALLALAVGAALAAWAATLIGFYVTSFRAVG